MTTFIKKNRMGKGNRKKLKRAAMEQTALKTSIKKEEIHISHEYTLFGIRSELLVCLFLAIITLAVYWQVTNHEFINLDDDTYITENHHIQSGLTLKSIVWSFTATYKSTWQPLVWLSHIIDYQLHGLNAGRYLLTNVLLHIANTLLFFLVFRRMTGALWQSAFVAALFALHPLHVESAAWAVERKDVLSTFFWTLTMWGYVRYVEHPRVNRYLLVLLFFILGLMAKPMLVTLPFVMLLLDYWPLERFQLRELDKKRKSKRGIFVFRLVCEKIPFFALAVVSCVVTFIVNKSGGALNSLDAIPLTARLTNALISYIWYIGKMVWPFDLAVLYPLSGSSFSVWQIVGACLLLATVCLLAVRTVRQCPYIIVGWLWYIGTMVPVIGVVQIGVHARADRFTYVPLIGLFIIIAWGAAELVSRWRYKKYGLSVMAATVLSTLVLTTLHQLGYWRNSITLFEHALKVTTNNFILHNNLGIALERQGRADAAIRHYLEALRIRPYSAKSHYNLGGVIQEQGRVDDAIKHYLKALRIKPAFAEAHNNLGIALQKQGRVDDAIKHYSEAVRIKPDFAEAHNNLGFALQMQGRVDDAIKHYSEAVRIKPDFAEAHSSLGLALNMQGRVDDAIKHYLEALRIKPDVEKTHNNLGIALTYKGDIDRAIEHFREALQINPNYIKAKNNLKIAVNIKKQGQ